MQLTDWELRKSGNGENGESGEAVSKMAVAAAMAIAPAWFKPEAGFTFFDEAGRFYVVIGVGNYREHEYQTAETPWGLLSGLASGWSDVGLFAMTRYKGTFIFTNLSKPDAADVWARVVRPT